MTHLLLTPPTTNAAASAHGLIPDEQRQFAHPLGMCICTWRPPNGSQRSPWLHVGFNMGIPRVRICHSFTVPLYTIPMTGRGSNLTKNARGRPPPYYLCFMHFWGSFFITHGMVSWVSGAISSLKLMYSLLPLFNFISCIFGYLFLLLTQQGAHVDMTGVTHIHTHVHTHVYLCILMCPQAHTHMHMRTCALSHAPMLVHSHLCTCHTLC